VNRSIQAEGAFGVLKENHGFRRFLLRGKEKVKIELLFLAIGYNINKLYNKKQQERCGQLLHEKKVQQILGKCSLALLCPFSYD
jgi:hypothetical protein